MILERRLLELVCWDGIVCYIFTVVFAHVLCILGLAVHIQLQSKPMASMLQLFICQTPVYYFLAMS